MKRRFSLGGVHPHDNKISRDAAIEEFPVLEKAYIHMNQHLGAPAEPVVAKGDKVKVGQIVGKPAGFISAYIHSSVSGTVTAVEPVADILGNKVMTVVVEVEGDEWMETIDRSNDIIRDITLSPKEILQRIAECGVVGLGGASFPTHVKLSPPPGKKAEFLILNGAECEPYLTSDYRVMMEMPERTIIGGMIMMKALGVDRCYIGVEENKPEAIKKLRIVATKYPAVEIVELRMMYPQGGEKQLIDAVIKRRVPSMGLPIDVGAVVQNVGTAFAVYEAVQKNKPLIDSIVSVTGKYNKVQRNFRLRVGTPIDKMIDAVGGLPRDTMKVVSGGPMMGKSIANFQGASVKASSGILVMDEEETKRAPETNCIRCAKCVGVCPMGLEPYLLNKLALADRYDDLEENKVYDCIECGCCFYTCPANIPLIDAIRLAKAEVMKIMRSRK